MAIFNLGASWKALERWLPNLRSKVRKARSGKQPLPGKIDHVIIVMLENRSFDHMLGYLSLDASAPKLLVDGLRSDPSWSNSYANAEGIHLHSIRRLSPADTVAEDPPHDRSSIDLQIHTAPAGPGPRQMGGFVQSFLKAHPTSTDPGIVMGHYDAATLPTYDFLSRNFCVCDRWFASVPLGTQANRLMAMSGQSQVIDNVTLLPDQPLVYDWLDRQHVPWRTYVAGGYAPFFLMMRRWAPEIVESLALGGGRFRRYSDFEIDWKSAEPFPSVIFIEPEYHDAPMSHPNDDHPPVPIARGQQFVSDIYNVVISNPARWSKTLLIVTYDEHGGLFDHVPPLAVETEIGGTKLATTGVRVPSLLISPYVAEGQVFSEPLDHTSILQFLAERFAADGKYSDAVSNRQQSLGRVSAALADQPRLRAATLAKSAPTNADAAAPPPVAPSAPQTPNAVAIDTVARRMAADRPDLMNSPNWREMKRYLDTNPPPKPLHQGRIN